MEMIFGLDCIFMGCQHPGWTSDTFLCRAMFSLVFDYMLK